MKIGSKVTIYDRHRFAIPLTAVVCRFSPFNDGVLVLLLESNNPNYPIHSTAWVHEAQLQHATMDADNG